MRCPFCGTSQDRVVDSRESREGVTIRRRRESLACHRRFTTYEKVEEIAYRVVKNDGSREDFDRSKLLRGLEKACEKRPVSLRQMERLPELDQVAYVRFASVYRRFEDVGEFMDELKTLLKKKGSA